MFDDLQAYFYENVVGAFESYLKTKSDRSAGRSKDLRAALTAATALYHLREHLPSANRWEDIVHACSDYGLLGDIANAAKHSLLTKGNPKLTSAQSLSELIVVTRYEDEQGEYSDVCKVVIAKLKDGSEREVGEVLTNVMNFWGDELARRGVLKGFDSFPLPESPGSRFIPRADAHERLDQEIIRGVRFKQSLKLQRFNPKTGKSDPIDLSGYTVSAGIYKPAYSFCIGLTDQTGQKHEATFDLTDKEAEEVDKLKDESERKRFVEKLAKDRQREIQNMISDSRKENHGS